MAEIYSDAQKRATMKYKKKLKKIQAEVRIEEAERFATAAAKLNMSFRAFMLTAMNEKIERDIECRKPRLGDTVYCIDSMDDIIAYTYIASEGDFVFVSSNQIVPNLELLMDVFADDGMRCCGILPFHQNNVYLKVNDATAALRQRLNEE